MSRMAGERNDLPTFWLRAQLHCRREFARFGDVPPNAIPDGKIFHNWDWCRTHVQTACLYAKQLAFKYRTNLWSYRAITDKNNWLTLTSHYPSKEVCIKIEMAILKIICLHYLKLAILKKKIIELKIL